MRIVGKGEGVQEELPESPSPSLQAMLYLSLGVESVFHLVRSGRFPPQS